MQKYLLKQYQFIFWISLSNNLSASVDAPKVWILINSWKRYSEWCEKIKTLLEKVKAWELNVKVAAIISKDWNGWERKEAYNSGIKFERLEYLSDKIDNPHNDKVQLQFVSNVYQSIVEKYWLEYIFLSNWQEYVAWLTPHKTIDTFIWNSKNQYMWLSEVETCKRVLQEYKSWMIDKTFLTISYFNQDVDKLPIIAQIPVVLNQDDTINDIKNRIIQQEINNIWKIYQLVVSKIITWSWDDNDEIQMDKDMLSRVNLSNDIIFWTN